MSLHRFLRFMSHTGHRSNIFWTNMPGQEVRPEKVEVGPGGYLDPEEPGVPTEVMDFQAVVRGAGDGITTFLLLDRGKAAPEDWEKFIKNYNMQNQIVAWVLGGYQVPRVRYPVNSEMVLPAHDAVQKTGPEVRRLVAAPFIGLDLNQLKNDATHLGYVQRVKLSVLGLWDSLDRVDACESQSIAQRLRPIWEDAWSIVSRLPQLVQPLAPLNKLFAGAAEKGVETRSKIDAALGRQGGASPGPGTPPAVPPAGGPAPGTTGGDTGAHGGVPAGGAPGTGTATPATHGHTGRGHSGHKKPTT